jgi:hypothetical protein
MMPITQTGAAYLKTATAAPDFDNTDCRGIPDDYSGKSVTIKDMWSETISVAAGAKMFIIVPPVPGVTCFTHTLAAGAVFLSNDQFAGRASPLIANLFDQAAVARVAGDVGGTNTNKVDQGRCVSLSAELVAMDNPFNSFGTIQSFRTPLACVETPQEFNVAPIRGAEKVVTGMDSVVRLGSRGTTNASNAYFQPARHGVYNVSMRGPEEALFWPIDDTESAQETHVAWVGAQAPGPVGNCVRFIGPSVLWDRAFDSIVFIIDVPAGAPTQTFGFKIWKEFEFKPTFNSFAYQLAGNSAPYDPSALALYKQMARVLPVAVAAKDNPDFWDSILKAVNLGSGLLQGLPGLGGVIARGVHGVSSYLSNKGVVKGGQPIVANATDNGSGKVFVKRNLSAPKKRMVKRYAGGAKARTKKQVAKVMKKFKTRGRR